MNINYFLRLNFLFLLMFAGCLLQAVPADVSAYFLPQDAAVVQQEIQRLFDGAQERVLVASYYITDHTFVDQLIALRRRNIDVQVIFDIETTPFRLNLMNDLIRGDIIPVISPFSDKTHSTEGRMHNKFIVIDGADVLTGSANFTGIALKPGQRFNDENIVIIKSPQIAQKYEENFFNMEKLIFVAYNEKLIAQRSPDWMNALVVQLYQKNIRFKDRVLEAFRRLDSVHQNYLIGHFSDLESEIDRQDEEIINWMNSNARRNRQKEERRVRRRVGD